MAAFDQIKLSYLIKLCTLSRSRLVQTRHYYLLQYFDVKQIKAVFRRCSSKYMFLKTLQILRKTPVLESLFKKVAGLKETPIQMFSCVICGIFKNTFCYRTRPVVASEQTQEIYSLCGEAIFWLFSTILPWFVKYHVKPAH